MVSEPPINASTEGIVAMVNDIVFQVRNALKENVDETTKASSQKFFKEEIKNYGVKTATVTQISKTYFKMIESRSLCVTIVVVDH